MNILLRLREVFQIFFPSTCEVCGQSLRYGEQLFCTDCLLDMPRLYLHTAEQNPVNQMFEGRVAFKYATALFTYQKHSNYAHLIHKLKYQGRTDIGKMLGEMFGTELQKNGFLETIDAIVPIPLHKKRERKRGYNQSRIIAEGISHITNIPILDDAVIRSIYTNTQTKKNKEERSENVQHIFSVVHPELLNGKHVLILDDVITTGATCVSCAKTILAETKDVTISFASLALA